MTIGENIKYFRKKIGLTQRELAERCELATGTIQQYELRKRQPSIDQLRKIATALGVSLFHLTDGDYSNFSSDELQNDFLKAAIPLNNFHKIVVNESSEKENTLLANYRALNTEGKKEANKRVEELTEIKKYTEIEKPSDRD